MENNKMNIESLETQLVVMCSFTDTIEDCQTVLKGLAHLERFSDTVDASDTIRTVMDIVLARGNLLRLESIA